MENKLYRLVFLTAIIFFAVGVQAQRRNARYVEYINKYSDLAVEQMKLHKFPQASLWHRDCLKAEPETASWHARVIITSVLSVAAVGADVRYVMMTMPAMNVSVPTSIPASRTKTIPTF